MMIVFWTYSFLAHRKYVVVHCTNTTSSVLFHSFYSEEISVCEENNYIYTLICYIRFVVLKMILKKVYKFFG